MDVDWGELYRTALPDLVRFLHRKVWDIERARDLAQDTFVRALRENPDNPRSWLFTVAANLARDEARMAIRRKRHLTLLKNGSGSKHRNRRSPPGSSSGANARLWSGGHSRL